MKISINRFANKLKKSGLFVLAIFTSLTLIGVGIANINKPVKKETISLILSTRNNPFFTKIEDAVKKRNQKLW